MTLKFRNIRSSPPFLLKKCSKIIPQIYRRTPMPKYEFIEDALQQLSGTASKTAVFKEHCLMNASIFCSSLKLLIVCL